MADRDLEETDKFEQAFRSRSDRLDGSGLRGVVSNWARGPACMDDDGCRCCCGNTVVYTNRVCWVNSSDSRSARRGKTSS